MASTNTAIESNTVILIMMNAGYSFLECKQILFCQIHTESSICQIIDYAFIYPPSTGRIDPVVIDDNGLSKNRTAFTTSSTSNNNSIVINKLNLYFTSKSS